MTDDELKMIAWQSVDAYENYANLKEKFNEEMYRRYRETGKLVDNNSLRKRLARKYFNEHIVGGNND